MLVSKCLIVFQVFIKFRSSERNTENTMSHLYLNEESDHSEENTCKNEVFRSTIEKTKHASAVDLLHTVLEWEISNGATTKGSHCRNSVKNCVL